MKVSPCRRKHKQTVDEFRGTQMFCCFFSDTSMTHVAHPYQTVPESRCCSGNAIVSFKTSFRRSWWRRFLVGKMFRKFRWALLVELFFLLHDHQDRFQLNSWVLPFRALFKIRRMFITNSWRVPTVFSTTWTFCWRITELLFPCQLETTAFCVWKPCVSLMEWYLFFAFYSMIFTLFLFRSKKHQPTAVHHLPGWVWIASGSVTLANVVICPTGTKTSRHTQKEIQSSQRKTRPNPTSYKNSTKQNTRSTNWTLFPT